MLEEECRCTKARTGGDADVAKDFETEFDRIRRRAVRARRALPEAVTVRNSGPDRGVHR